MHFSVTELLLIAFIVFMLFGSKRMRNLGGDLGTALRDFRKAMNGDSTPTPPAAGTPPASTPLPGVDASPAAPATQAPDQKPDVKS